MVVLVVDRDCCCYCPWEEEEEGHSLRILLQRLRCLPVAALAKHLLPEPRLFLVAPNERQLMQLYPIQHSWFKSLTMILFSNNDDDDFLPTTQDKIYKITDDCLAAVHSVEFCVFRVVFGFFAPPPCFIGRCGMSGY